MHRAKIVHTRKKDRQGKNVWKLNVINDYNMYIGGTDCNGGMIGTDCYL